MKNQKSFLIIVSLLACCLFIARSQMIGGWSEKKKANEDIQTLLNKTKEEIEGKTSTAYGSLTAVSYQEKPVNGVLYRIKAKAQLASGKGDDNIEVDLYYKPFSDEVNVGGVKTGIRM